MQMTTPESLFSTVSFCNSPVLDTAYSLMLVYGVFGLMLVKNSTVQ